MIIHEINRIALYRSTGKVKKITSFNEQKRTRLKFSSDRPLWGFHTNAGRRRRASHAPCAATRRLSWSICGQVRDDQSGHQSSKQHSYGPPISPWFPRFPSIAFEKKKGSFPSSKNKLITAAAALGSSTVRSIHKKSWQYEKANGSLKIIEFSRLMARTYAQYVGGVDDVRPFSSSAQLAIASKTANKRKVAGGKVEPSIVDGFL